MFSGLVFTSRRRGIFPLWKGRACLYAERQSFPCKGVYA